MAVVTKAKIEELIREQVPKTVGVQFVKTMSVILVVAVELKSDGILVEPHIYADDKSIDTDLITVAEFNHILYRRSLNIHKLYKDVDGKTYKRRALSEVVDLVYNAVNRAVYLIKEQYENSEDDIIYVETNHYNSVRHTFYKQVKESKSSVWVQKIGKKYAGDWQNGVVMPDVKQEIGEVRMVRRRPDGTINLGKYTITRLWDGEGLQEYSD